MVAQIADFMRTQNGSAWKVVVSDGELVALLHAAHYLDMPDLVSVAARAVSQRIPTDQLVERSHTL